MTERSVNGRSQEQALLGLLQQAPVFQRLAGRYLQILRKIARPRTFVAGDVVIEAGAVGPGLFVLLKGKWAAGDRSPDVLEPITTAGELAELMGSPQLLVIRSVGDSIALHVAHELLAALFARDAEFHQRLCRNVIADLSGRLVGANKRLDRLGEERAKVEDDLSAAQTELNNARMLKSMRG